MPLVFGIEATPEFTEFGVLLEETALRDANPANRALAENLQMDHRIGEERARELLTIWEQEKVTNTRRAISNALRRMQGDTSKSAGFRSKANSINLVPEPSQPYVESFATVVSAQSIVHLARKAGIIPKAEDYLFSYLDEIEEKREDRWTREIERQGKQTIAERLIGIRNQLVASYDLCWGAPWTEFVRCVGKRNPFAWKHAVGMTIRGPGECLMVLRYEIPEDIPLYRPTQLEAGACAEHYPSPDNWKVHRGGCCMITGPLPVSTPPLVREFVHQRFAVSLSAWQGAARELGEAGPVWVVPPLYAPLREMRSHHAERLRKR